MPDSQRSVLDFFEDYLLALYYRPVFDPNAALRAVWSSPLLLGPLDEYGRRSTGPFYIPDVDEGPHLEGVLSLSDGREMECFTYCVVDGDGIDLVFGIRSPELRRAWPEIGEQDFGAAWELELEEFLFALAEHVLPRAPFQRALTGVGFGACPEEYEPPRPVPQDHWTGIIEVRNGQIFWHPPTRRYQWVTDSFINGG